MIKCTNCSTSLDTNDKFCPSCGAKVSHQPITCLACGANLQPEDDFCSECGAKVNEEQRKCPSCGAPVDVNDKHCSLCGSNLTQPLHSTPTWRPKAVATETICKQCEHFREAIPLSSEIPYWTGTAISQALMKIEEDQVKQSAAEASHRAYLIETGKKQWDRRPIMSAFCAAKADDEIYEVCEVKNRERNCPDFETRSGDEAECETCLYFEGRKNNPFPPQSGLTPEIWSKKYEAIEADIALEITELWATKGIRQGKKVIYHDFCTYYGLALPYVNLHKDCKNRRQHIVESELYSNMRKRKKKRKPR